MLILVEKLAHSVDVVTTGWIFVDYFVGLRLHRRLCCNFGWQRAVAVISENGLFQMVRAVVARLLHLI